MRTPTVRPGDAWAGKNLGVKILSTVAPNLAGGYWDIDKARIGLWRDPVLEPGKSGSSFIVQLQSEPGLVFEILSSTNLLAAPETWTASGVITNATGRGLLTNEIRAPMEFFRARQLP